MPVNVLEQLLGGVVTPSVVIDLLPGHEGYAVSLSNHGNTGKSCFLEIKLHRRKLAVTSDLNLELSVGCTT